jgi:cell volume regulation protein A
MLLCDKKGLGVFREVGIGAWNCNLALLVGGILLLLSVVSSKASGRLGVPALVLFLAIGMLAGSEGLGIYFDDAQLAQALSVPALVLILFSGGFDTVWHEIRPVVGPGALLATLGVLLTAGLVGLFGVYVLDMAGRSLCCWGDRLFYRCSGGLHHHAFQGVGLRSNLKSLVELESGSNDPMAILLTTGLITLILLPESSLLALVAGFVMQMLWGGLAGYLWGRLMVVLLNQLRLGYEGLYPVLLLALVLLAYSVTAWIGGNGFLAVYLAGIVVGNRSVIHQPELAQFFEGLAWPMQIAMFLTLGLLVFPSQLFAVAGSGLLMSAFLLLLALSLVRFLALALFGCSGARW